jgi:hypothetical protein
MYSMANLDLGARPEFNGFASKDRELFWSTGVLVKAKAGNFNSDWSFHYFITPPLHHSSRLPQEGKTIEVPPEGSPELGPPGRIL